MGRKHSHVIYLGEVTGSILTNIFHQELMLGLHAKTSTQTTFCQKKCKQKILLNKKKMFCT